jgi:hypothetical protein
MTIATTTATHASPLIVTLVLRVPGALDARSVSGVGVSARPDCAQPSLDRYRPERGVPEPPPNER